MSESPLSLSERARLAELERENRQLRLDVELLGKVPCLSHNSGPSGGFKTLLG